MTREYSALTTAHDTSHLPIRFEGHPVPWITRWTNEKQPMAVGCGRLSDGSLIATYDNLDGIPDNRDSNGILWQREGVNRGGEPDWRSVNTHRQRACMLHRKCETCGRKIEDKVLSWVVPKHLLELGYSDPLTTQAPLCTDCLPIARDLCPHLRRIPLVLGHVLDYDIFGVFGLIFTEDETGVVPNDNLMYPLGSNAAPPSAVMAKQMIVRWKKYTLEEL